MYSNKSKLQTRTEFAVLRVRELFGFFLQPPPKITSRRLGGFYFWWNEVARLLFTRHQPLFTQNQRFSSHLPQSLACEDASLHSACEDARFALLLVAA